MKMLKHIKSLLAAVVLAVAIVGTGSSFVFAAAPAGCQTNPDGLLSSSTIGLPTYGCGDRSSFSTIIETVLKLVFGAMALISLLFIVIGGLKYTLSNGDSNAIASAKNTILYAIMGLVLGVSAFSIIGFVFSLL